ncbi:MAG: DUF4321 domain-containing protein [Lachnospiraceae bacterium]|nr:DUF4321 domain-containing protein [Lachnospiraceae bacterium]
MKGKNNWACFLMILSGIVIGGFIGSLFPDTFLNYGQSFGTTEPLILNLGVLVLTFGLNVKITLASIIGIVIAIIIYRFI